MKKWICLSLLLGFMSLGFAQKERKTSASQSGKFDLQSMVDTELAFARMSEERGTRPSFMAFIADDGILFRPRAVKGKQWMTENPVPPSDKRPLLSWYPTVADIARAGDMGYTTGPWEYKSDIHDAKPVAFGNFLTVWKKQADGSWKFAIDLGVSNPQPDKPPAKWQHPNGYDKDSIKEPKASVETLQGLLSANDRELSRMSAERGSRTAFESFAAADVRVFRNDKATFVGKASAFAALPASSMVWTWEPAYSDVSRSGDLGYTYGTYRINSKDSSQKLESGNYFRVWKKQGNNWLVVADLTDPVPEDNKN